jgi:hypothetical protein
LAADEAAAADLGMNVDTMELARLAVQKLAKKNVWSTGTMKNYLFLPSRQKFRRSKVSITFSL